MKNLVATLLIAIGNAALAKELIAQVESYRLNLESLPWISFAIAGLLAGSCGMTYFLYRWANDQIVGDRFLLRLSSHVGLSSICGILALSIQAIREAGPFDVIVWVIVAGLLPNVVLRVVERKLDSIFPPSDVPPFMREPIDSRRSRRRARERLERGGLDGSEFDESP